MKMSCSLVNFLKNNFIILKINALMECNCLPNCNIKFRYGVFPEAIKPDVYNTRRKSKKANQHDQR